MKHRIAKLIGSVIVIAALGGIAAGAVIAYQHSTAKDTPLVFSNAAMLTQLWNTYKKDAIEPDGFRTMDTSQDDITTSEGESYTMLRAVWMDDQTTFSESWQFTKNNLQRPDHLFAWKYGSLGHGKYGVLVSQGGENAASDGDVEIALALLMAYVRWNEPQYLQQAQQIIPSIWNDEVVDIAGKPILAADQLEGASGKVDAVINPSYFDPAAFKIFAKVDPTQHWTALVNDTYALLDELSTSDLGGRSSDGLPPDWIEINRQTGQLVPNATGSLDTNFSYNAMRIPWRLALDYTWFHDPRDKEVLSHYSFLKTAWDHDHVIDAGYAHDGSVTDDYQDSAIYGGVIGYFLVMDPSDARQIYRQKLLTQYSQDNESWVTPLDYYSDNWTWFGMALAQGALPNLTEQG